MATVYRSGTRQHPAHVAKTVFIIPTQQDFKGYIGWFLQRVTSLKGPNRNQTISLTNPNSNLTIPDPTE